MDIDNNEAVLPRSNIHKMIAALTGNHMCHNCVFRKKIPVDADCRSSRIFIIKKKCTKEPKSRSQYLDSLKKLVLSLHFLETNDVVVVQKFFQIIEFGLSVPLYRENKSNEAPGVLSNASQAFGKEGTTSIPSAVVREEHPASSENVQKLEEQLVLFATGSIRRK